MTSSKMSSKIYSTRNWHILSHFLLKPNSFKSVKQVRLEAWNLNPLIDVHGCFVEMFIVMW